MDHCNGYQPCGKTYGTVDGKEVIFPAGDPETAGFLPAMLEKSADTDLLILVEREGFLRNFTNLFYRLFLLLFCRIKVPTVHTPVQIWESSILKQIPPEKRTCFPENMVLAKMACPQLRISVFFSGRRSPLQKSSGSCRCCCCPAAPWALTGSSCSRPISTPPFPWQP